MMTSLFCSKIRFVRVINLQLNVDCRLGHWQIYNENCCVIL